MGEPRTGRRNRVRPDGVLVATGERGLFWGNRGALLDAAGALARPARGRNWIICALEFHGRHRVQWQPGRLTELYFLDEATALAAGHRPCAECRYRDHRTFTAPSADLPDATMIAAAGRHWLVRGPDLLEWTFAGYRERRPRNAFGRDVSVRTPRSSVAVLAAGYVPVLHPSAVPDR